MYVIHKQLIPKNNLIWVLKINENDIIYSFNNSEDAEIKLNELKENDTEGRDYKISIRENDGTFSDH